MDVKFYTRLSLESLKSIPQEMIESKSWLIWEAVEDGEKKPKKVPKYVSGIKRHGEQGAQDDLDQLATFNEAVSARDRFGRDTHGIGFALLPNSNIVCLDFDNAYDENGVSNKSAELLESMYDSIGSYAEFSPSGCGAHIFVKGEAITRRGGPLEIFSKSQFICITGESFRYGEFIPHLREMPDSFFADIAKTSDDLKSARLGEITTNPAQQEFANSDIFDAALLEKCLSHISPEDYFTWVRVGMAIKSRFGESGMQAWRNWSSQGSTFKESEIPRKWASFRRNGVNFGSIIAEAKVDVRVFFQEWRQRNGGIELNPVHIEKIEKDVLDAIWPDPVPLLDDRLPPPIDVGILPGAMGPFVSESSALKGCDENATAIYCVIACAAAIDDRVVMHPMKFDKSWKERACLWGCFVGDPSQKKSPSLKDALKPLQKIDISLRENYELAKQDYGKSFEHWKSLPAKERRENPFEMEEPLRSALVVNDTTVEALATILKGNMRGVVSVNDELSGWFGAMDAYNTGSGGSKDRPKWLELYNGGPRSIDRAQTTMFVKNWSASIVGSIQPDAIRTCLKKIPNDGLMQRFMVVCASRKSGVSQDRPMAFGVSQEYEKMINYLYSIDPETQPFELSDGARGIRESLERRKIDLISLGALPAGCDSFVGKIEGLFCRLALVWHCCEHYKHDYIPRQISLATAESVQRFILDFILPHAIYFYGTILGGTDNESLVTMVTRRILVHDKPEINNRDLVQSIRAWKDAQGWDRKKVMEYLEASAWVSPIYGKRNEIVKSWSISPKLQRDFSRDINREKERRRIIAESLNELRRK